MTVNELKAKLYERISLYWGSATVVWGATGKVKPLAPLVVLRLGSVSRPVQPIQIFKDGDYFAAYPSQTTLQVDLFTKGKPGADGAYFENSAESDLLGLVNFLDSPATVDWCESNDISVQIQNGVQDLSEVINDTQWQYRAMCELFIGFTEWVGEYEGVLGGESIVFDADGNPTGIDNNWEQSASGGGTKELADKIVGFFTEAEIKEVNKNAQ